MPRRTAPRCPIRGSADETLDQLVEMNLVGGDAFGHWDLKTRVEFARPWAVFGAEITRRWRAAFPGSRPMACYILAEIEPATWKNEWPALRRPLRAIEGCTVEIADCGWHKTDAERRLAEPGWSYYDRYESIVRE
jgi:hypothetical protein